MIWRLDRDVASANTSQNQATHAMPRTQFEVSSGGSVVCVDFRSMAGLVDAVMATEPSRLTTLLHVIWGTHYKLETRTVLKVAIACRDPLADLGSICKDALRTLADLEALATLQRPWTYLSSAVPHGDLRANALLHACDEQIAQRRGAKRAPFEAIRQRLANAAARERAERAEEIRIQADLRQARCPKMWQLFEQWRDTD